MIDIKAVPFLLALVLASIFIISGCKSNNELIKEIENDDLIENLEEKKDILPSIEKIGGINQNIISIIKEDDEEYTVKIKSESNQELKVIGASTQSYWERIKTVKVLDEDQAPYLKRVKNSTKSLTISFDHYSYELYISTEDIHQLEDSEEIRY